MLLSAPQAFDILRGTSSWSKRQSIAIMVSPLVLLVIDQVHVRAAYIAQLAEADVCDSVYQLVFLSPEALLSNETWRDMVPSPVYQENLVAVVID